VHLQGSKIQNDAKKTNSYAACAFLELKMHRNLFSAVGPSGRAHAIFPDPYSRMGSGYPLTVPYFRDAFGVSIDSTATAFSVN